ncbi:MAG: sulfotransferase family protein [Gemmatimonadaceae bacterium]
MSTESSSAPKVFGIGLSKTGTSSLTEALNMLGVRSVHYPHDDDTFRELRDGNYRLSVLREYDGVVDIPVAPFFAQLDAQYPGSKFILTVRGREAWLRSIELHWRLMMDWWHNFPQFKRFHEFISACAYGSIGFNAERFSYAYDAHEREVRRHFAGRPHALLVLDICGGEGWERLCPFLGAAVPDVPFPHANEWMHLLMQASQEIASLVPEGAAFILVDEQGFGREVGAGRTVVPFLERDGEYWGAPPDTDTAIRELERLRAAGASFVVFGWPAFWYFDHYTGLREYLDRTSRRVLGNDRVIAYDLRRAS